MVMVGVSDLEALKLPEDLRSRWTLEMVFSQTFVIQIGDLCSEAIVLLTYVVELRSDDLMMKTMSTCQWKLSERLTC
jgi:hypothetical protein